MTRTRHDWWNDLAKYSKTVAKLQIPIDEPYWDVNTNQPINAYAYNIGGCSDHTKAIARWIDALGANGVPLAQLEKLIIDLTSRNTLDSSFKCKV